VEQLGQLMTTKFIPLKEFSIPGTKRRLRDKTTKEVVDALASVSPAGVEESLRDALLVAFRKRPGEDESFAVMTIEYAETLVSKHLEKLDARIKSFDTEAQAQAAVVTAAKEAAEEAKKHYEDAQNEYIVSDNQLLAADTLAEDAANEENQLKSKAAELAMLWKQLRLNFHGCRVSLPALRLCGRARLPRQQRQLQARKLPTKALLPKQLRGRRPPLKAMPPVDAERIHCDHVRPQFYRLVTVGNN